MFRGKEYIYEVNKEKSFSMAAKTLYFPAVFKCIYKTYRAENRQLYH